MDKALEVPRMTGGKGCLHQTRTGGRIQASTFETAWQRIINLAVERGLEERFTFQDLKAKGVSDFDGDKKLASGHRTDAMVEVYDRKPDVVIATRWQGKIFLWEFFLENGDFQKNSGESQSGNSLKFPGF